MSGIIVYLYVQYFGIDFELLMKFWWSDSDTLLWFIACFINVFLWLVSQFWRILEINHDALPSQPYTIYVVQDKYFTHKFGTKLQLWSSYSYNDNSIYVIRDLFSSLMCQQFMLCKFLKYVSLALWLKCDG